MGYSDFQTRHLYVVNAFKEKLDDMADPGDVCVGKTAEDELYFNYIGALGDLMRSDMVPIPIAKIKSVASDTDVVKLRGWKVALNADINGGKPVNGVRYPLFVHMTNFIGLGDSNTYDKSAEVVGFGDMSASDFYKLLAYNLVLNEKKDPDYLYCVYLKIGDDETFIDRRMTLKQVLALGDATAVCIYEAPQKWELLRFPQRKLPIELYPLPAWVAGEKVIWWDIEEIDSDHVLPQGQRVAELEAHTISERGDVYYGVGWPDAIITRLLVDPKKDYDLIDIHYWFSGRNEAVQKSEKDIQLACVNDGSHTVANALIAAINSATNLGVSTLSVKNGGVSPLSAKKG